MISVSANVWTGFTDISSLFPLHRLNLYFSLKQGSAVKVVFHTSTNPDPDKWKKIDGWMEIYKTHKKTHWKHWKSKMTFSVCLLRILEQIYDFLSLYIWISLHVVGALMCIFLIAVNCCVFFMRARATNRCLCCSTQMIIPWQQSVAAAMNACLVLSYTNFNFPQSSSVQNVHLCCLWCCCICCLMTHVQPQN